MWQLDYPWLLLLLPLPWLAYRYLPEYREARSAVRVPFFASLSRAVGQTPAASGITAIACNCCSTCWCGRCWCWPLPARCGSKNPSNANSRCVT